MKEKKDIIHIPVDTSFLAEVKNIVEQGRQQAYASVSQLMIETYWKIGERIVLQEQKGKDRADYGTQLIEVLSEELTIAYGKGFSSRYLRAFRQFYLVFPDYSIWKSRFPNLTWTHILKTLRVENSEAIRWYLLTASQEMWSVRTLDRNISTQYYERHFKLLHLPYWLWTLIGIIAFVKTANQAYSLIRNHKIKFLHTAPNRLTGMLLFVGILFISQPYFIWIAFTISCVALFAAIQECILITKT